MAYFKEQINFTSRCILFLVAKRDA